MNQNQQTLEMESNTEAGVLYMAMELSNKTWKLGFSDGSPKVRTYNVEAGNRELVLDKIARAKKAFKLSAGTQVVSCYEAGRDGFWIHRWLTSVGIINRIMDAASIEVSRHKRRAKTDRLDLNKLLDTLKRYERGERNACAVVRVPTVEEEDLRRLTRELERLQKEQSAHTVRIRSLLALHGIRVEGQVGGRGWEAYLASLICWDGSKLPEGLHQEIVRESDRLLMLREQIRDLEKQQKQAVADPIDDAAVKIAALMMLRGIGMKSSWLFVLEMFGWRQFNNGREVGGFAGLTGSPYSSGDTQRDQGISKAGNKRVRRMAVEIAWCWLKFQPQSKLSLWYFERFGHGGKRMRRVGIVALARKLLVAFWRYLEHGQVPEGAEFAKG